MKTSDAFVLMKIPLSPVPSHTFRLLDQNPRSVLGCSEVAITTAVPHSHFEEQTMSDSRLSEGDPALAFACSDVDVAWLHAAKQERWQWTPNQHVAAPPRDGLTLDRVTLLSSCSVCPDIAKCHVTTSLLVLVFSILGRISYSENLDTGYCIQIIVQCSLPAREFRMGQQRLASPT